MTTLQEIGSTIKLLRKEKDKSLKEVADNASISKSYLWDIENEKGTPDLEKIDIICGALDADPVAVILKAKAEKDMPKEKKKLLRDYKPILEKIQKMIEELYDNDDDDQEEQTLEKEEELEEAHSDRI